MTETQFRYKTDAQDDFENRILSNETAFSVFVRMYLERAELMEPFLQWCWETTQEDRHESR